MRAAGRRWGEQERDDLDCLTDNISNKTYLSNYLIFSLYFSYFKVMEPDSRPKYNLFFPKNSDINEVTKL